MANKNQRYPGKINAFIVKPGKSAPKMKIILKKFKTGPVNPNRLA